MENNKKKKKLLFMLENMPDYKRRKKQLREEGLSLNLRPCG